VPAWAAAVPLQFVFAAAYWGASATCIFGQTSCKPLLQGCRVQNETVSLAYMAPLTPHTYIPFREILFYPSCLLSTVTVTRRVTQIMSTEALLLNASLESFSPSMNWWTEKATLDQMHPRTMTKTMFYENHAP